jgi:predicted nuclease with TOPRIM domain
MVDTSVVVQTAGAIVLALITIAFSLQKLFKSWKETSTESSIMGVMHTELERMSKQNTLLSLELGKLQVEILNLNKELRTLTVENQRLHSEVATLTTEVNRLQSILVKNKESIDNATS